MRGNYTCLAFHLKCQNFPKLWNVSFCFSKSFRNFYLYFKYRVYIYVYVYIFIYVYPFSLCIDCGTSASASLRVLRVHFILKTCDVKYGIGTLGYFCHITVNTSSRAQPRESLSPQNRFWKELQCFRFAWRGNNIVNYIQWPHLAVLDKS